MITIQQVHSVEVLQILKSEYLQHATAPLDGMWLVGFVPTSTHYGFYLNTELIGYCCVNEEGYLLQFHLIEGYDAEASALFARITANKFDTAREILGAFTSTAEPIMLSYCADVFTKISVNALMYQLPEKHTASHDSENTVSLQRIDTQQLALAVAFAHEAIGAPREWLTGYFQNLIARQELFGYWDNETLAATGECRLFDGFQSEYADLGVIVATEHRGKGVATKALEWLIAQARSQKLKPICSTEKINLGAQKAISRAGFITHHRIIQFSEAIVA